MPDRPATPFITDHFLLQSDAAVHLYHTYAEQEPILDYHCHLSPRDVAENRRFENLYEIWLEGDHYKWRAMRSNGIPEKYCTGDATPYEKFLAWARTVPYTLRNPLYHWTHLELKRYFGIDTLLDESTAPTVWARASDVLRDLTVQRIFERFQVKIVCTTDDPADTLAFHEQIAASNSPTDVLPAYRPDKAFFTQDPAAFNEWTNRLAAASNMEIRSLRDFQDALARRHADFHRHGCRLSDHGLEFCYAVPATGQEAAATFDKVRAGATPSQEESERFAASMMLFFGRLDTEKGWTKQLHLGALRNVNTRMLRSAGRDTGFDTIGDWPQLAPLAALLDLLDRNNSLPRTILYNLNPAADYAFAGLIGSFAGEQPGKMQYGSAWWFLDQKDGIEMQLNALSSCGLLSRFVGMLTDSRSFMSYPRHEYFRRVLCNVLGGEMEKGLLPNDEALVGAMVRNICYRNAKEYFGFPECAARSATPAR